MSFGFSIGDFIAVIDHAKKIRKEFGQAPAQFAAISTEVRNLSFVVQDVEVDLSTKDLDDCQKSKLFQIAESCRKVLTDIEGMIDNYSELSSGAKGNAVKRAWKRLKWEPADVIDLRNRLSSNIGLLNAFHGQIMQKNITKLVQHQDNQEREAILNWLSPVTYATKQNDYIRRRQPGTGQWLLDSPELQAWLVKPKQTLFCPGIPGAGKTIFTSILIEELHSLYGHKSDVGIAFVYCNFKRHEEQDLEHLLASLLRQLAQSKSSVPESLKLLYNYHRNKDSRPSIDDICKALSLMSEEFSQVFIVIDALDEYLSSDRLRARALDEIFHLQTRHNLNFLATSRFIPEIATKFNQAPSLEICASNPDVMTFLTANLNKLPSFVSRNPELQHEIIEKITEAAGGVFLLAQLHLDSLVGKRSPKAMRSALNQFSTGSETCDPAYNDVMQRIEGQVTDRKEMAKQILSWITCAVRELTIVELQTALAVELGESHFDEDNLPDLTDMVSVCAGLVTVDEQSNIIRLVHFTAQEYFQRTWTIWFSQAHHEIGSTCVTYLSFQSFGSGACPTSEAFGARVNDYPLFSYAAKYWGHHVRPQLLDTDMVVSLLDDTPKLEACVQAMYAEKNFRGKYWYGKYDRQAPQKTTGLHLAACFGLTKIVEQYIQQGNQIDARDSFGRTPLSRAAANDHEEVVKALLNAGVDIDCRDTRGQTPLSQAAFCPDKQGRTPLSRETSNSHEAVAKLLLEGGADPESVDKRNRTPLLRAAMHGREIVVKLLLGVGVDPNSQEENGRTPLSHAASRGYKTVFKLLLERGADLYLTDKEGRSPLYWAAMGGSKGVLKLLLQKGANPDSKDEYRQTPLSQAAYRGREAVTRLLLDHGVDPDHKDEQGRTPLSLAASRGHEAVVRLLLDHGVDSDHKDKEGRTPLSCAALNGYEAVTRLLLDHGVDPDHKDEQGRTPLSLAASRGHEAVVRLLLDHGVDPDHKDKEGRTPLSLAASYGQEAVVRLLLDHGVDPDHKDKQSRTPLSLAAISGCKATTTLLLDHGVDPDHKDEQGWTPLSLAVLHGYEAIITLLLDHGVDPDPKDKQGRTPFWWAVMHNSVATMKLLLDIGVDPNFQSQSGWSPLSLAVYDRKDAAIALLKGKGVDLDATEKKLANLSGPVLFDPYY